MKKTILVIILTTFIQVVNSQNWNEIQKVIAEDSFLQNTYEKYGYDISISGNYAVIGAHGYEKNKGKAYVIYYNGVDWETKAILTASDGEASDYFGNSVCISGDNIIIGAYGDDDNGSASGSAYVFEKPTSGWVDMAETAKLTASDGAVDDKFGFSVSIWEGNIVIGAYFASSLGLHDGSVYVFEKPITGWVNATETTKLSASDITSYDYFGKSVSIWENFIVVGASDGDGYVGSAYLFQKPIDGWSNISEIAKLTPSNGEQWDKFGNSICIYEDNIIIGAPSNDSYGRNGGIAYVYEKPVTGWINMTETAVFAASNIENFDYFGRSVCVYENNVVIGAAGLGAAYIFKKPLSGWVNTTESVKLTTSDGAGGNKFGQVVSIDNDRIIVGNHKDSWNGEESGSVYYFNKDGEDWVNSTEIDKTLPTPYLQNTNINLGYSVSVSGNYAVVGAYGYNKSKGRAYVLNFNGNDWEVIAKLSASDGIAYDYFGNSVNIYNDLIVVGAYYNDDNGTERGAAYMFEKPLSGWEDMTETAKLTASTGGYWNKFGASVSVSNDVVIVGAPKGRDGSTLNSSKGNVCIFKKPASGWEDMTETILLVASDAAANGRAFGSSVDISGDYVIVGDEGNVHNGYNTGSAYLFENMETSWSNVNQIAIFTSSDSGSSHEFGKSVSIYNDNIVIGGSYKTNYVFSKPESGWEDMNETAKLTASNNDYLDKSVSIYNDIIVGGTFNNDVAYLFKKNGDTWTDMVETARLTSADETNNIYFGSSVFIDNDNIIIGAYGNDENGTNSGAVYFFKPQPTIISHPVSLSSVCPYETVSFLIIGEFINNYQWQVSSNNGTNWSDIIDNSIYTGSNDSELDVIPDMSIDTYLYRCLLTNEDGTLISNEASISIDTEEPMINSTHNNQLIGNGYDCDIPLPDYTSDVIATDNCDVNLNVTQNPIAETTISGGTNPVTLTVTDDAGNTVEVIFNVEVEDNTHPVITCIENQTVDANETHFYIVSGAEFEPTELTDNCGVASVENDFNNTSTLSGVQLPEGTTTIIWTITDNSENGSTCSFDITVNAYVGIETIQQNGISIYPNPTNGIINFEFLNNNIQKLTVSDITGKQIIEKITIEQKEIIDLSSFVNGIYIISIQSDNEIFNIKIVKR